VGEVGIDENFFEIGGHSLLLVTLQRRLRAAMDADVTVIDLFRFPTVRALAAHLAAPASEADARPAADDAQPGHDRAALRREMMRRRR
jgi:aryl carrier-like protein